MPNITTNHAITYTNVVSGAVFSFFQKLFDPVQREKIKQVRKKYRLIGSISPWWL